jgi:hypothetical protein
MTMAHNCILEDHDMLSAKIAAYCLFSCEMEIGHITVSRYECGEGIGS